MNRLVLILGCLLCATGVPAADRIEGKPAGLAAPALAPTPAAVTAAAPPAPRQPLKLAVGDIREYMSAEEFRALSSDPEPERNTVIVEARVPLLPMKHESEVPGGIIAPLWALANPAQGWRIFLPDLKRPESGPLESKIPPPVFRWGP